MSPERPPGRVGLLLARPRDWPRPARAAGVAALVVAAVWGGALAFANRAASLERLRARVEAVLRQRLGEVELGPEVSVDWLFRATVGPVTVPAATDGALPVVRVHRVKVRASFPALLGGRVVPASVKLYGVQLAPGPGGRELSALVERLRDRRRPEEAAAETVEPGGGQDPVLHLRGLEVTLPGGQVIGPLDGRLSRERDGGLEEVHGRLALGGGGTVEATLRRTRPTTKATATATATPPVGSPRPSPAWTLSLSVRASPADLPPFLRHRSVQVTRGELSLQAEAAATPAGATATLRGTLTGLTLAGEPLGPEPIGPLTMDGEAELGWRQRDQTLSLTRAVLHPAGPLAIEVRGSLAAAGDRPFDLEVRLPPIGYRALVDALPAALAPGPAAPRPDGSFSATLTASGLLAHPAGWSVSGSLDLAGLREAARRGPPVALRGTFTARTGGDDERDLLVGPENPDFVPIAELPEHVVRAVTTSEDAGFFGHRGFDFDELKNAAVAGAAAGKLGRGGSTITQQLAKNLFLSRDRTLARKAREALVAVALEGTVPKARLLEIYLNVVEWGPGLHGLGPAARHYFDRDARALTPREACFLAAIVPSPRRSHAAVAAGRPASLWAQRIDDLLLKLQVAGVLDEAQLMAALAEPLAFRGVSAAQDGADAPPAADEEPPLDEPKAPPAARGRETPPEPGSGG